MVFGFEYAAGDGGPVYVAIKDGHEDCDAKALTTGEVWVGHQAGRVDAAVGSGVDGVGGAFEVAFGIAEKGEDEYKGYHGEETDDVGYVYGAESEVEGEGCDGDGSEWHGKGESFGSDRGSGRTVLHKFNLALRWLIGLRIHVWLKM